MEVRPRAHGDGRPRRRGPGGRQGCGARRSVGQPSRRAVRTARELLRRVPSRHRVDERDDAPGGGRTGRSSKRRRTNWGSACPGLPSHTSITTRVSGRSATRRWSAPTSTASVRTMPTSRSSRFCGWRRGRSTGRCRPTRGCAGTTHTRRNSRSRELATHARERRSDGRELRTRASVDPRARPTPGGARPAPLAGRLSGSTPARSSCSPAIPRRRRARGSRAAGRSSAIGERGWLSTVAGLTARRSSSSTATTRPSTGSASQRPAAAPTT